MGLFGKKKDYTETALEEARCFDAPKAKEVSLTTPSGTSSDKDAALAALMAQAFGGTPMDAGTVASGETVSVLSVRHMGAADGLLKGAIAAMGMGPQEPDSGFSAALDTIERDYKGKPVADAKAAIEAALKEHHHTVPDQVVDMIAKGVSEGNSIDVKFGDATLE